MTTTTIIYPVECEKPLKEQYEKDFMIIEEGDMGMHNMRYMKLKLKI